MQPRPADAIGLDDDGVVGLFWFSHDQLRHSVDQCKQVWASSLASHRAAATDGVNDRGWRHLQHGRPLGPKSPDGLYWGGCAIIGGAAVLALVLTPALLVMLWSTLNNKTAGTIQESPRSLPRCGCASPPAILTRGAAFAALPSGSAGFEARPTRRRAARGRTAVRAGAFQHDGLPNMWSLCHRSQKC